jgi:hypothetical protein
MARATRKIVKFGAAIASTLPTPNTATQSV